MKKKISLILLVFWMGVIFYFSHQTGDDSSEASRVLVDFLVTIFNFLRIEIALDILNLIVRKSGHFFLYFVLGILTLNVANQYNIYQDKKRLIFCFLFCVLYACFDEINQMLIPGRYGSINDVLIDSFGSISGIFLFYKNCFFQKYKL